MYSSNSNDHLRQKQQAVPNDEDVLFNDKVLGTRPKDNIIYREIGRLYASINQGHLRFIIDLQELQNVSDHICDYAHTLNRLVHWTNPDVLETYSPQAKEYLDEMGPETQNDYPSGPYTAYIVTISTNVGDM